MLGISECISLRMAVYKTFYVFAGLVQVIAFTRVVYSEPPIRGKKDGISFTNFVQHTNHKLDAKPLKTAILASELDCLTECNVEGRCLSVNFNTTNDECNLLDTEIHEYLEKFTPTNGTDHFSMPVGLLFYLFQCFIMKS